MERKSAELRDILSRYDKGQVFIVADEYFKERHETVEKICPELTEIMQREEHTIYIHASEETKNIGTVESIWTFLLERHATRKALIINIGGGIVSDTGGFAAATYRRGIDYVNIPTTLLAMVDAASGGKTGINYPISTANGQETIILKNQIGAFREPVKTLINTEWLRTLPEKELLSGMGEIIKTALIESREWLDEIASAASKAAEEGGIKRWMEANEEVMRKWIERSIEIKRRITAADPTEQGIRKSLNLGHTIGHAIEEELIRSGQRMADGSVYPHGYCIYWGLIAETKMSVKLCHCPTEVLKQVESMRGLFGKMPDMDTTAVAQLTLEDKKNESASEANFSLLGEVGEVMINQKAGEEVIKEALRYMKEQV